MINWKEVATIEYRYAKSIERDYRAREAEINRMYFPAGQEADPVTRAELTRSARTWAAIVQGLKRELRDERTHNIELLAELEGWKDEALEGRKRDDMA